MTPRLELVAISKIRGAVNNPKQHDYDGIVASIRRHGFKDFPLINESTGRLVAGHGRLKALKIIKKEGPKPDIDKSWPPENVDVKNGVWYVPVVRGMKWDNDQEASAFLAAHNQLTMSAGWDTRGLADLFREVRSSEFKFAGMGFSTEFVTNLIDAESPLSYKAADAKKPPVAFQEVDPDEMELEHRCPKCGFEF